MCSRMSQGVTHLVMHKQCWTVMTRNEKSSQMTIDQVMTGQWLPTSAWLWLMPAVTQCLYSSICSLRLHAPNGSIISPSCLWQAIFHLDCTTNTNRCSCIMHPTSTHPCVTTKPYLALFILLLALRHWIPRRGIGLLLLLLTALLGYNWQLLDRMTVDCSHQVCMALYLCIVSFRNADQPPCKRWCQIWSLKFMRILYDGGFYEVTVLYQDDLVVY